MNSRRSVLVVDDNPLNLEICREILEDTYAVSTAADGLAAICLAARQPPDAVLLDIMLPGIDGYETCRRLRAMSEMRGARIVILSAKAMPAERAAGFVAGADAYLTKPFDDTELLATIRSVLDD